MDNQNDKPQDPIQPVIKHIDIQDVIKHVHKEMQEKGFEHAPQEYTPGFDEKNRTIFIKIANVMAQVDRIPKSGYNKTHDYHYVTESDVVGTIRPLMAKEKLVLTPDLRRYKVDIHRGRNSDMYIGTTEIRWILRDAESYETLSFGMIGKGIDTLEKDIYKSITGNKKYALITLFMVDSGDDPERNDTPTDSNPPPNNQGNRGNQNRNQSNQQRNNQNRNQNQNQNRSNTQNRNTSQNAQNRSNQSNQNPGTNTGAKPNNGNSGQSGAPGGSNQGQPTKKDVQAKYEMVSQIMEPDKKKTDRVKEFEAWYKEKTEAGADHRALTQTLTKKMHELNNTK